MCEWYVFQHTCGHTTFKGTTAHAIPCSGDPRPIPWEAAPNEVEMMVTVNNATGRNPLEGILRRDWKNFCGDGNGHPQVFHSASPKLCPDCQKEKRADVRKYCKLEDLKLNVPGNMNKAHNFMKTWTPSDLHTTPDPSDPMKAAKSLASDITNAYYSMVLKERLYEKQMRQLQQERDHTRALAEKLTLSINREERKQQGGDGEQQVEAPWEKAQEDADEDAARRQWREEVLEWL